MQSLNKKIKLDLDLKINQCLDYKVSEDDVYITEFVSNNKGFNGILKQKFSDFIVHELTALGKITCLDSFEIPNIKREIVDTCDLLDENVKNNLEKLNLQENEEKKIEIDVSNYSKNERTNIHKYIKNFTNLKSNTESINEKKIIVVTKCTNKNNKYDFQKNWPQELPPYIHFLLYQENRGTFESVNVLARYLHLNAKNFAYAGTKDKRSISTQQMSLYKVTAERLIQLNKKLIHFDLPIALGNFSYEQEPLRLGQHCGNKFSIVLRDVQAENDQIINESIECLKKNGFINYFGTQRFGRKEATTSKIGALMLQQKWEDAVNEILSEKKFDIKSKSDNYDKSFNECIKLYKETKDADLVYKEFAWKYQNEGYILKGLSKNKNNYFNALFELPRNNRMIYLHAYQSLIWNKLASIRIKEFGMKVIIGDLVLNNNVNNDEKIKNVDIIVVDETNINNYNIFDVLLPLPGTDIVLPKNKIQEYLIEYLKEDSITLNLFKLNSKSNALYGAYRKLILKPLNVTYEIIYYNDNAKRLFSTDLDNLKGIQLQQDKDGNKKGLKLEFCLPASSYATVLIREITKNNLIYYLDEN